MLERATACFKAGARDSLRCAKNAPRSQRMLHSTFWTHGASDLDLPPWAVSMPPPPDLPLKHDSTCTKKSTRSAGGNSPPDAPFLDFLYPPQALAWLHRSNGQHWERWEKRNARRLPEGFIQASRGYSSRSRGKDASKDAYTPFGAGEEHVETAGADSVGMEQKKRANELPEAHTETSADRAERDASKFLLQAMKESSNFREEGVKSEQGQYTHSPGDLAEESFGEQSVDPRTDPLGQLQKLLGGGRSDPEQDVVQDAWHLYNSLDEDDKSNVLLKKELLLWLNKRADTVASAHCISLYLSLPLRERSLDIYEAVLASFLRRRDHDSAFGVHRDALSNISNGSEITKLLFRYYLRIRTWARAWRVKREYDEYFANSSGTQHEAMFWYHVGEMSDLQKLTSGLLRHMERLPYKGSENVFHNLATRMVEECFLQLSREKLPIPAQHNFKTHLARQELQRRSLELMTIMGRMIDYLVLWSPKARQLLEDALMSLLRRHESQQYWYIHPVASHLYAKLCEQPDTKPSQEVLRLFVARLEWFHSRLSYPVKGGLDLPTILNDWQSYHGILDSDILEQIIRFYASQGDRQNLQKYADYLKAHYPQWTDRARLSWAFVYVHALHVDVPSAVAAFEEIEKDARSHNDQPDVKTWNSLLYAHRRADDLDGALKYLLKFLATGLPVNPETIHAIADLLAERGDFGAVEDLIQQVSAILPGPLNPFLARTYLKVLVKGKRLERADEVLHEQVQETPLKRRAGLTRACNIVLHAYAVEPNIDATMRIYRLMKSSEVRLDGASYSALMQALVNYRQTPAANRIMTHIMRREKLVPNGVHYSIIMQGYVGQQDYAGAVAVYRRMKMAGVRPTVQTQRAYLKAKLLYSRYRWRRQNPDMEKAWRRLGEEPSDPLEDIRQAMESFDPSTMGMKGSSFGRADNTVATGLSTLVDFALEHYTSQNELAKVEEVFALYQSEIERRGLVSDPPERLLRALMLAHYRARNHDKVETIWKTIKAQADMVASVTTLPDIRKAHDSASNLAIAPGSAPSTPELPTALAETNSAEVGFASTETAVVPAAPAVVAKSSPFQGPRPAPGRAHVLTSAVHIYLRSLLLQRRTSTMIKTVTQLLNQGYRLDVATWNKFIEYLCNAPEVPLLLAFILTERYLMPGFPGWQRRRSYVHPKRAVSNRHVDWMKIRYENKSLLLPHYQTLLYLGKRLKELESKETTRGTPREEELSGMKALRGTVKQIMDRAPKAIEALETMPFVNDQWQMRILRDQGKYPYGEEKRHMI